MSLLKTTIAVACISIVKNWKKNGTQKNAVIDMRMRWLNNQKITYDLVDDYEIEIKSNEDAKKRYKYNNAYSLLVIFCKTRYSKNDAEFRWHNLLKLDYIVTLITTLINFSLMTVLTL